MVLRGQIVAKVVDQRGHHHLDVGAILFGAGGRLQRMFQPVDLVAGKRAAQPFQRAKQPVGKAGHIFMLQLAEEGVILGRAFIHAGEADGVRLVVHGGLLGVQTGCSEVILAAQNGLRKIISILLFRGRGH